MSEREVSFILDADNGRGVGGGQMLVQGPASPTLHHQSRSKRFDRQKEEAMCRNGTVSSESS